MIELSPDCVHMKDDDDEQTPLHWACSEGHTEIASTLISVHGAKLDAEYVPLKWDSHILFIHTL